MPRFTPGGRGWPLHCEDAGGGLATRHRLRGRLCLHAAAMRRACADAVQREGISHAGLTLRIALGMQVKRVQV